MDSSSNDSFAWSHVSNNSGDSESDSAMSIHNKKQIKKEKGLNETSNSYENFHAEKKAKKRKLEVEPSDDENSMESPKKNKVKIEECEDTHVSKKKRKKKDKNNTSETLDYSEEQYSEDYHYLNVKVKEEHQINVPKVKKKKKSHNGNDSNNSINEQDISNISKENDYSEENISEHYDYLNGKVKEEQMASGHKIKKKKRSDNEDNGNDSLLYEQDSTVDISQKKEKKSKNKKIHANLEMDSHLSDKETPTTTSPKKRKSKREKTDDSNDDKFISEDKFSAEETVVQKNSEIVNHNNLNSHLSDKETPTTTSPKKHKSKREKTDDSNDDNFIIEDKFSAEETVVQKNSETVNHNNLNSHLFNEETPTTTKSKKRKSKGEKTADSNNDNFIIEDKSAEETVVQKNSEIVNHNKLNDLDINGSVLKETTDEEVQSLAHSRLGSKNLANKSSHGGPNILDRIRFEDETDSDIDKSQNNTDKELTSSQIKKFLKGKPTLKPVLEKLEESQEITDDDEVWILKCPYELNVADFIKKDLILDSKSKIKINGETYNGNVDEDIGKATVMTSDRSGFVIKNIQANGIVTLRKRLPKPHMLEDNMMPNYQTDFIPLPETKCRHPLFGSNYKKSLKIPASVAHQLNNMDDMSTSQHCERKKKKKKHKKDHSREEDECDSIETQPKIEPDVPKKKAKKRKHDHDFESPLKKAKRVKQEPDSSDMWESEKAIEENLFNF